MRTRPYAGLGLRRLNPAGGGHSRSSVLTCKIDSRMSPPEIVPDPGIRSFQVVHFRETGHLGWNSYTRAGRFGVVEGAE
jgi:hypothetical protein